MEIKPLSPLEPSDPVDTNAELSLTLNFSFLSVEFSKSPSRYPSWVHVQHRVATVDGALVEDHNRQ
jgi:hypothetical protein